LEQIIIHVDMDAFYASVEMRDNPALIGKPVIIGAPPGTRGVVSTCNYEARKYGVHSAMNIKEAYRLCPNGVFIRPDFHKYHAVSDQIHRIWSEYATAMEAIALDEAYLDVTETAVTFDRAREMAHEIKRRVLEETGLSCSVGLAYSKIAAKTASEENKPNGYYEILTAEDYVNLMIDRDVREIYTVGVKTAEKLHAAGIHTMRDIRENSSDVIAMFGKHGQMIVDIAYGRDDSRVVAYRPEDAKSISRELTFQEDVFDFWLLSDVLLLLSVSVVDRARSYGLCGNGVSLKVTYSDMKGVTRSKTVRYCDDPLTVHREAVAMLEEVSTRPVRLIGVGVYNVTPAKAKQMTFDQLDGDNDSELERVLEGLGKRYRMESIHGKDIGWDNLHDLAEHMRTHRGQRSRIQIIR
jgi:DNA polymerase-4/DNA polymerase IV (DinB-like DNA polymerase)